ncbi:hypothetical protein UFOVP555_35 [uncultured Caudovirales phage]|uniref:Uncharacterized protein n=1 Tax=uncultured Caudovirales phage TaxID=2100421 RepID=A0A6J5MXW8_9CAUD|nr:hypothetical protein UFOVP555_35 [uncultured Caudovirales phage]
MSIPKVCLGLALFAAALGITALGLLTEGWLGFVYIGVGVVLGGVASAVRP